jgi:hypothetical protein
VIVVSIREPGAAAREARETATQLWGEPVDVVRSKLIDRNENDERGRLEHGRLTAGTGGETNEEKKRSEESDHRILAPRR